MIKIKTRKLKDIERKAAKQAPKKGKVVRLTPDLASLLEEKKREGETVSETFLRILKQKNKAQEVKFALPSSLYDSIEEARGEAILKKVRTKTKTLEKPVSVSLEGKE